MVILQSSFYFSKFTFIDLHVQGLSFFLGWICLYHLQPLIPEHVSPIKMWEMSIKAIDYKAVILYLLPF